MAGLKVLVLEPAIYLPSDTHNFKQDKTVKLMGLWIEHASFIEEVDLNKYNYSQGYIEGVDNLLMFSAVDSTPVCVDVGRFVDKDTAIVIKTQFIVPFKGKEIEVLHEHAISFTSGMKCVSDNLFFTTSLAVPALFRSHGKEIADLINKPYNETKEDLTTYSNYPNEYVETLALVSEDEKFEMWYSTTYTALTPNRTGSVIAFK
ncbi:hypothetical protein I6F53_11135 [Pseudoalteromonas sp. SWN29]|uniref:hypothetical protein n=1 Tax=Pseudoalteromonas sp. SWN29 TaxID=2792064 RepID=UPI0018CECDEC|nr:hypothetical protein [Pseudoalteromonas sp. SWN29]MBH0027538.1 hypothetical protein [Pseudoalteromonas sp. SWN29]